MFTLTTLILLGVLLIGTDTSKDCSAQVITCKSYVETAIV